MSGSYDVVGHSFGGRIIIKLASKANKENENLRNIVLIGAAGIKSKRPFRKRFLQSTAKLGNTIFSFPGLKSFKKRARKLLYKVLRVHDYEKTSGVMKKTFLNVIDEDLTPLLEHINCSALLLWGTNDTYVPISAGKLMYSRIKGAKIEIIEGGRHGIHKTHAELVGKWINDFLK